MAQFDYSDLLVNYLLPAGYKRLLYIENPIGNSAYLYTGVKTSSTLGFSIDAVMYDTMNAAAASQVFLFGGRASGNSDQFSFGNLLQYGALQLGGSSQQFSANIQKNVRFQASLSGTTYTCGGTSITVSRNISTTRNIDLFCMNNNSGGAHYYNGHGRVYSLLFTDDGESIAHLIPCKDGNNVVGMYDIVQGVFRQNSGEDVFTAGDEVPNNVSEKLQLIYDSMEDVRDELQACYSGFGIGTIDTLADDVNAMNVNSTLDEIIYGSNTLQG